MSTYSPYFLDVPTFDAPYVAPQVAMAPAVPHRPVHLGHRRTSSAPTYDSAAWIQQPPSAPLLNSPAKLESSAWMYNGWSAALPVPTIETSAPAPSYASPHRAFPSVLEQTPAHSAYLATQSTSPYTQPTAQVDYSVPAVPTMPITPPDSRSGSIEADYTQSSTSSTYLSTPTTYLRPPAQDFKGLTINTPTWSAPSYPYTPPISPNVYYTPYSTPSLYSSSSSAQTTVYTPSPPAEQISPTLAPEISYKPAEPLVGLGLGMGMGMNMDVNMGMGMGMGVPQIQHDVFYTPNMGSEEYFTTYQ